MNSRRIVARAVRTWNTLSVPECFVARLPWFLAVVTLALSGCLAGSCPQGERSICRATGDCRCGPPCQSQADCSGLTACARYQGVPRTEPGVCVDALWLFQEAPPCLPLCRDSQLCVAWTEGRTSCANQCTADADCAGGCCAPLREGTLACAPADICRQIFPCGRACADNELCVTISSNVCAKRCDVDADCAPSCCLGLEGGGGVCAPGGVFCPSDPPPPCRTLEACTRPRWTRTPDGVCAPGETGYDGAVENGCEETAVCRACWWSPATRSYSDCVPIGQIPTGATAPLGTTRCAASFVDPPVRVRCTDVRSAEGSFDCLGQAPL